MGGPPDPKNERGRPTTGSLTKLIEVQKTETHTDKERPKQETGTSERSDVTWKAAL